jgi:hypothetical protein
MRIVPLLPSSCAPGPWRAFPAAELAWDGALHPDWTRPVAGGPPVHALHLPDLPWGPGLGETALAALRPGLGADFLVLRAPLPQGRTGEAAFMAVLEGLLEVTRGQPKLALRPAPSAAPGLVQRLRAARGEAVGFCWDAALGADLDCISDRLFCAVGEPGDDFRPIQRLGYRWNLAIPAADPDALLLAAADIARAFPPVLFPEEGA